LQKNGARFHDTPNRRIAVSAARWCRLQPFDSGREKRGMESTARPNYFSRDLQNFEQKK